MNAFTQFRYLWIDIQKMTGGGRIWRWYSLWFQHTFIVIFNYRINRFFYLLLGEGWSAIRVVFSPLLFLLRPWGGGCEIHYRADIGPGFHIRHPAFGIVVSARTIAGKNLLLVGGNCLGMPRSVGEIRIGDNVMVGASANILGPVNIGNNVSIGMSAVVVNDIADNLNVVGIPAIPVQKKSNDA